MKIKKLLEGFEEPGLQPRIPIKKTSDGWGLMSLEEKQYSDALRKSLMDGWAKAHEHMYKDETRFFSGSSKSLGSFYDTLYEFLKNAVGTDMVTKKRFESIMSRGNDKYDIIETLQDAILNKKYGRGKRTAVRANNMNLRKLGLDREDIPDEYLRDS